MKKQNKMKLQMEDFKVKSFITNFDMDKKNKMILTGRANKTDFCALTDSPKECSQEPTHHRIC